MPRMPRLPLPSVLALIAFPAVGVAAPGAMEQWKEYAEASIAPQFDWYEVPTVAAPTVLGLAQGASLNDGRRVAVTSLRQMGDGLGWSHQHADFAPRFAAFNVGGELSGRAVNATFAGTRLGLSTGMAGEFGVSAIVARQHFATQGFGSGDWDGSYTDTRFLGVGAGVHESSTGTAVRLDWRGVMEEAGWGWDVALQSRIEMDPFKAYRGVYSEPGDFDIPGFARVALDTPSMGGLRFSAEIQRVFYREIATFTSAGLPTRFLALLGDGNSPDFAWRDLTVYAIEARYSDDLDGAWTLRFASQQQPRPTSALLDRALSELYSDQNVALSYERVSEGWGQFRIGASYSPVTYFLGSAPYLQRGFETGRQVEFEAQWTLFF